MTEAAAIPHWPGRLVNLGDHQVYVRSVPGSDPAEPAIKSWPVKSPPVKSLPVRSPARQEPALCVHGLEGSSRNWTDLMELLRPELACEALDLPGFGDSPPRPDGRYSIAALAQTVTALIEKQKRGPVHLIGNSLGGAVCVRVAATRPELIRTLTLISPALPDLRPRLDLVRFPVMSLPWFGARVIRQYQVLPPERRVADVITTCFSDPGLFPRARFAAEVAELTRRDSLGYAAAALVGSVRTLTSRVSAQGPPIGLARRGPHHRTVTGHLRQPRPRGRSAERGPGRARVQERQDRGAAAHRPRRADGASWPGGGRDRYAPGRRPARAARAARWPGPGIPARFRRLTVARAGEGNTRFVRSEKSF